jgi:phosphomannomutase
MDPKNTRQLRASVKKRKVALGVCFSGDAASCAFVDERGATIRPDLIAAALARMFIERNPGAAVVLDLRSTRAAVEEIQRAGGVHVPARVGPVFIKKAMADRNAVFGADLQGRFYFRENFFCESAILACVHVLNLLTDTDRKFSEVIRSVNRYRSSGELRFPCPDPDGTVQEIADAHAAAQTDALDGITARYPEWSFNVRRSPTESAVLVTLEARSKKAVVERLAELRPLLGEPA